MIADGASQPLPVSYNEVDWTDEIVQSECAFCHCTFRFRSCRVNGSVMHANLCNGCSFRYDYRKASDETRWAIVKEYAIYHRISNSEAESSLDSTLSEEDPERNSLI